MNKVFVIIVALMLLAGCGSNEGEGAGIYLDESAYIESEAGLGTRAPDIVTSESEGIEPIDSHPDTADNTDSDMPDFTQESSAYESLKAEFEKTLERTRQEGIYASNYVEYGVYIYELYSIFAEMLNYRESLDDFDTSRVYVIDESVGREITIVLGTVFTDGDTGYKVFEYGADGFPPNLLQIQIFDKETVDSQLLYSYWSGEGGVSGKIVYYSFRQDSGRLFLTVVHKEKRALEHDSLSLVNYEINGRTISNYDALKEDAPEGKLRVTSRAAVGNYTVLCISYGSVGWHEGYDIDNDSQLRFEDNEFSFILNNEEKEEITLLFGDGFWEVIEDS